MGKVLKPSLGEWMQVAEVLAKRLTECVHVYKHNVHIFMPQAERQRKSESAIVYLRHIHTLLDKAEEQPSGTQSEAHENDEEIIGKMRGLFSDILKALPGISLDMQKLLNSAWMKVFPDKISEVLFWGDDAEWKGIASGHVEDGRLPGKMAALIDREDVGDIRPSRNDAEHPKRHDETPAERWMAQNADYLRKAGRVD